MSEQRQQAEILSDQGYVTVARVASACGVSRMAISLWIRDGRVKVLRVGRRTYVERASLASYLGSDAVRIFHLDGKP